MRQRQLVTKTWSSRNECKADCRSGLSVELRVVQGWRSGVVADRVTHHVDKNVRDLADLLLAELLRTDRLRLLLSELLARLAQFLLGVLEQKFQRMRNANTKDSF